MSPTAPLTAATGPSVVDEAHAPATVRNGPASVKQAYASAQGFEEMLLQQLSSSPWCRAVGSPGKGNPVKGSGEGSSEAGGAAGGGSALRRRPKRSPKG